jgi:hypothetical protein
MVRAFVVDTLSEVTQYAPHTNSGASASLRLGRPEKGGKMRKSLWIMLTVLLVAIAAPSAHADTLGLHPKRSNVC